MHRINDGDLCAVAKAILGAESEQQKNYYLGIGLIVQPEKGYTTEFSSVLVL